MTTMSLAHHAKYHAFLTEHFFSKVTTRFGAPVKNNRGGPVETVELSLKAGGNKATCKYALSVAHEKAHSVLKSNKPVPFDPSI